MTASTLLVPIHFEVLVADPEDPRFAWNEANYDNFGSLSDPMPKPFVNDRTRPPEDVKGRSAFLHWALPDGLTHGHAPEGGGPAQFPLVPNRWLVARLPAGAPAGVNSATKIWVIESDYYGVGGASAFPDPRTDCIPGTADSAERKRLGRRWTIEEWQSRPGPDTGGHFLRAIAPGNIAFAAFAPFCRDVFSFIDTTLPEKGKFTYLVAGWFSDAVDDPLDKVKTSAPDAAAKCFADTLSALDWSVAEPASGGKGPPPSIGTSDGQCLPPPTRTVYHAFVYEVDAEAKSLGLDNTDVPVVVVAPTAMDALATLIEADAEARKNLPVWQKDPEGWARAGSSLRTLMQAAGYDLLDTLSQADGRTRLQMESRNHAFSARPGGTFWEVVPRGSEQASDAPLPALTDVQRAAVDTKLAALNQQQRKLDEDRRVLEAKQRDLYHLWWKRHLPKATWETLDPSVSNEPLPIDSGTESIPYFSDDGSGDSPKLSELTRARVDKELDPRQPGSLASEVWASLWRLQQDEQKLRLLAGEPPDGDTWFGLLPDAGGKVKASLSQIGLELKRRREPRFYYPTDPVLLIKGLRRSHKHGEDGRESADGTLVCRFDVDSAVRDVIETKLVGVPEIDKAVHRLLAEIPVLSNASAGSTRPFFAAPFKQAWSPVFLEWEAKVYPTGASDKENLSRYRLDGWEFDGDDLTWRGTDLPANPDHVVLSDRVPLSPHVSAVFRDKLNKYLTSHTQSDDERIRELLKTIDSWDLLAQGLSGLTDKLLTLDGFATFRPPVSGAPLPAPGTRDVAPLIGDLVGDEHHTVPRWAGEGFFPVRAGLCELTKLNVIGCFGQIEALDDRQLLTLDPQLSPGYPSKLDHTESALPEPSEKALRPMFQMPPRIAQPARLGVSLLSAAEPTLDVLVSAQPDPLCGWLIPNHLDGGIAVYDSEGRFAGEIEAGDRGGVAPSLDGLSNQTLRAVVRAFSGHRKHLSHVLAVIDETSWTVDPVGDRADDILSVLVGRPLAIVRARIDLRLEGPPLFDQRLSRMWDADGKRIQDSGDLTASPPLTFDVRLGSLGLRDDGLMGYFTSGFDVFHAVHMPVDVAADSQSADSFIRLIGPDNPLSVPLGGAVEVTMILDPRAKVHASTGILPVAEMELPAHAFERLLAKLCVQFRVGPILGDATSVPLPRPGVLGGAWSFLPGGVQITDARKVGGLAEARRVLHEGRLELNLDDRAESGAKA